MRRMAGIAVKKDRSAGVCKVYNRNVVASYLSDINGILFMACILRVNKYYKYWSYAWLRFGTLSQSFCWFIHSNH